MNAATRSRIRLAWPFAVCVLLALGLRLVVWHWREFYPLSGDEQEYLKQALTLLQQRQYVELNLMRPPLYTVFLAGSIVLVDSAIQQLRLVQALISAATVIPLAALAWELFRSRQVALVAAALFALNYTLAATASELLTETVFLFGLCLALWLVVAAPQRRQSWLFGLLAGLALGALTLVRSVALPLVALATVWLFADFLGKQFAGGLSAFRLEIRSALRQPFVLLPLACCLVILPWTARNYALYGAPILVDTTGAENLWLDNNPSAVTANDPLGRESAKRDLYALGENRAARQTLATERGLAEIRSNPAWFAGKAWAEAKKFFALQYVDELRSKRAIWVPQAEVWAKILLGDGLWLLLVLAGICGCASGRSRRQAATSVRGVDPAWLLLPWAGYIFATALIFHVELRYRLPLYPVFAPFAALALVRGAGWLYLRPAISPRRLRLAWLLACVGVAAVATMTLLHRNYLGEAWLLANKHAALSRAERALARRDGSAAQQAANAALGWDGESALAQVALARAALLRGDRAAAKAAAEAAIAALPAQPYGHLLRGALLREAGDNRAAQSELAYETASLDDLQAWSWQAFAPLGPPPHDLAVGNGLDLGYVRGFYPAEAGFRWSSGVAMLQLACAPGATTVELELAPGRPENALAPSIVVQQGTSVLGRVRPNSGWHLYSFPLDSCSSTIEITLQTDTFRPRAFDRTSADNRELGVMLRRAAVR